MTSVVVWCHTYRVCLVFRCDLIFLGRWEKTQCDGSGPCYHQGLCFAVRTDCLNSISATSASLIALWPGHNAEGSAYSFRDKHLQTNALHPAEPKGFGSRG